MAPRKRLNVSQIVLLQGRARLCPRSGLQDMPAEIFS